MFAFVDNAWEKVLSGVKLFVLFNLIWCTAAESASARSCPQQAGRLINWTAKPFIKFNKALFRGSGDLVLVTRASAAIPANHIIIMRLYYGSKSPPLPPTHPANLPSTCFVFFITPLTQYDVFTSQHFSSGNLGIGLFQRPGQLGQARVISHLVKITEALNAPVACCECQEPRDWQLDGIGSICMAFS